MFWLWSSLILFPHKYFRNTSNFYKARLEELTFVFSIRFNPNSIKCEMKIVRFTLSANKYTLTLPLIGFLLIIFDS